MKAFFNAAILLPIILAMVTILFKFGNLLSYKPESHCNGLQKSINLELCESPLNNQKNIMTRSIKMMHIKEPAKSICTK